MNSFFLTGQFFRYFCNPAHAKSFFMLSGSFFYFHSFRSEEQQGEQKLFRAEVILNPDHPIFGGHFPGNPVVPGVCQLQMIRELIEKAVEYPVKLRESDNIKFLRMIDPGLNPVLTITLTINRSDDRMLVATATIGHDTSLFLKFKGTFEPAE